MFEIKPGHTFVTAEIGINHQSDLEIAKRLVDAAVDAGADCAKFQVKTPHMSLPPHLWNQMRDTPFGRMKYIEYRQRMELSPGDLMKIAEHCRKRNIIFAASAFDFNAADKLSVIGSEFIKIPSCAVTNLPLIEHIAGLGLPVIMSTGMSSHEMVQTAVEILQPKVPSLSLLACTSKYPAPIETLNLARMQTLREQFPGCHVGYSGHEVGLWTTLCAVAMGAEVVERHVTLDRSLPGSDHASSIEPQGLKKLVKEIRNFELARGTGELRIQDCEQDDVKRLRMYPLTGATQVING